MPREHDLTAAASAAGLIDHDLLRLVMPDLPPAEAVADLRLRYPGAFKGMPVLRKDMTPNEMRAELDRVERERRAIPPPGYPHGKHVNDMSLNEMEVFERHHGMSITASERMRRETIRARQRDQREMSR